MRSMLVIGLGRFGRHLATKLIELGNEVMVIDKDEERVSKLAPIVTASQIGDCQDEEVLRAIGVNNFDICFVCVSDDFQCSLEVTSTLKELGARYVVAKADREKQIKFLKSIGADEVINTEMDMAQRAAVKFSARNTFDYIELTPEYSIIEIEAPPEWVGSTIAEVGVRHKYRVNVIGVKVDGKITPLTKADHIFVKGEHLIIAGGKKDGVKLIEKR